VRIWGFLFLRLPGSNFYKLGSWFCKHFEPAKAPFKWKALEEFKTIKNEMVESMIYRRANGNFLFEHKI
jgi:hypothetical protein